MNNSKTLRNLALLGILTLPAAANSAILTESTTAPTGSIISQPDFSGTPDGGRDATNISGTPSQSFTVGATGFRLGSITVKGSGIGGFTASTVFVLSIRTRNASDSGSTGRIGREVTQQNFIPASGTSYLTFTLATPIMLAANGVYAFDIYTSDSTDTTVKGTGGSAYTFDLSTADVLTGGQAFQNGYYQGAADPNLRFSEDPGRTDTTQARDRTFFLNAAVPEPSSVAAMSIALGVVAFAIRRRVRSAA